MLDKQKLLQWLETKLYVYDGPYDDDADEASCKGRVNLLRILEMDIAAGRLDAEEKPGIMGNESVNDIVEVLKHYKDLAEFVEDEVPFNIAQDMRNELYLCTHVDGLIEKLKTS